MLAKLLTYDFRALNRSMIPLQAGVFVIGLFGCFLVNVIIRNIEGSIRANPKGLAENVAVEQAINGSLSILAVLLFAIVFASIFVTLFLIAQHIYKTFMGDEGYLTFTLPVTNGQLLMSKIIVGVTWLLINGLILALLSSVFLFFSTSTGGLISSDAVRLVDWTIKDFASLNGLFFFFEAVVLGLLAIIACVLQAYLSVIVGGLARTRKVLAAIGIYFGSTIVILTFMSFVFSLSSLQSTGESLDPNTSYIESFIMGMHPVLMMSIVLTAILIVAFYFLSSRILKNKVNLD